MLTLKVESSCQTFPKHWRADRTVEDWTREDWTVNVCCRTLPRW